MAKNNYFINQAKKIYHQQKKLDDNISTITPQVYAAIALALHRHCDVSYEDINYIFAKSQEIWFESIEKGIDMLELCEKETGIEMRYKEE